jgi:hypothetical protein
MMSNSRCSYGTYGVTGMDDKINQDKVQSGRKAPDVALTLSDGSQRRLSDFWQEGRLVLVLLRHLG